MKKVLNAILIHPEIEDYPSYVFCAPEIQKKSQHLEEADLIQQP
jgi:hypothetical protein